MLRGAPTSRSWLIHLPIGSCIAFSLPSAFLLFRDVFWEVHSFSRSLLQHSCSRLRFMTRLQDRFSVRTALHAAVNINDVYIACDRRVRPALDANGGRGNSSLGKQPHKNQWRQNSSILHDIAPPSSFLPDLSNFYVLIYAQEVFIIISRRDGT